MNNEALTCEQLHILKFAQTGHNMCIFGKGGVGKSTLVQEISKQFKKHGIRCQIVCASGISCDVYRVYQKKVNNYKMAYKSNMQLNFRRIFCEHGYFKVF